MTNATDTTIADDLPRETTSTTTVTTIQTTSLTSDVITTQVTSTTTHNDAGDSDASIILPVSIVIAAFVIGIVTAVIGIYIYRRHFHVKLPRPSTMPLANDEHGSKKSQKDGISGPYSIDNIEKFDDGYMEIKG